MIILKVPSSKGTFTLIKIIQELFMKLIYEQTKIVKELLSKQKINTNLKYRKNFYIEECYVDEGVLLFNTITYELLFLNNKEYSLLNDIDINNDVIRFLVEEYFLVPTDFDDKKFASQVIETRLMIQNMYTEVPLDSFVILPTTGCNARCFYCFEHGAKISNMTEQTAHDVADFIEKKGTKNIKITWFGGEPLINQKAIDIICKDLVAKNIQYTSKMISNGYLLDEATVKKAVELWNLKKIQITLDGTEEIYNKVKDYVYKDVSSPFKKVLNNIESALKANLFVIIRINMDEHNADDISNLANLLIEHFSGYEKLKVNVVRLFEDTSTEIMNRTAEERHKLIKRANELQHYINVNIPPFVEEKLVKSYHEPNSCMACTDSATIVVPDGHLGKCEHYVDSDFYGSIYSDEKDIRTIQRFKERRSISPNCINCKYRSLCLPLKCCSGIPMHCDDIDKQNTIKRIHSTMKNVFKLYMNSEANN